MDAYTGAKPAKNGSRAAAGRDGPVSAGQVGAGISLILVVGLVHLIDAPEELEESSYLGFLFLANFLGALAAAVGIYRGNKWGWALGVLVAGGAFVGYVISRTVGLPGMPIETEWMEPLGVLSLVVETLFVGVLLTIFARPAQESTTSSPNVRQGGRS